MIRAEDDEYMNRLLEPITDRDTIHPAAIGSLQLGSRSSNHSSIKRFNHFHPSQIKSFTGPFCAFWKSKVFCSMHFVLIPKFIFKAQMRWIIPWSAKVKSFLIPLWCLLLTLDVLLCDTQDSVFLVSGKNNFRDVLIEYVAFVLIIVFHLLKVAKYWQVEMFVAHAGLSQYVNPAKRLPCPCLSPSLTAQLDISPFLQKKTSSVPSIEPLSGQVWPQRSPQSRWNPFISPLFAQPSVWFQFFPGRSDSRFESALLPPHLEVGWFGRATRKWWDTKYRAWRADYFARRIFVSSGWPQKSLCDFV